MHRTKTPTSCSTRPCDPRRWQSGGWSGAFVRCAAAGSIAVLASLAGTALAARAASDTSYQVLVGDGSTGTVFFISVGSTTATAIPAPVSSGVESLAVSPDGSRVYVAFKDGMLGTISTVSDSYVGSPLNLGASSNPGQMVVTPDGTDLYVAETGNNQVVEIDTSTDALVGSPIAVTAPLNLVISPDGTSLFVDGGSQSSSVSVITTSSNTVNASTIALAAPGAMTISPDGSELYVSTDPTAGPAVVAIDTTTYVVGPGVALPTQGQPADLALAPDGSEVYVPDSGGQSLYVLGMMYFDAPASSPPAPTGLVLGLTPGDVAITADGATAYLEGTTSTNAAEVVAVDPASSTLASPVVLPAGTVPSGLVIAQVAVTPTPTPLPTPTPSPTCTPLPVAPLGPGPVSVPPNQPAPVGSASAGAGSGGSGAGSVVGSTTSAATAAPTSTTTLPQVTPPAETNTPTPVLPPSFCCGSGTVKFGASTAVDPTTTPPGSAANPPTVSSPAAGTSSPAPASTSSPTSAIPILPPATPVPSPSTGLQPILCFAPVIAGPAFPGAAALTSGVAEAPSGGLILPAALALLGLAAVGVVVGAWRRGFRIGRLRSGSLHRP
jgi:YVTN family beta-propeller protein